MQLAAHLGISEPVELCARPLPGAWRRRDREHRADQAALLRQPAAGEPDWSRSGWAATRLRRAARPRALRLTHHTSLIGVPPNTSATRARVPRLVSSGSASIEKNPCPIIS